VPYQAPAAPGEVKPTTGGAAVGVLADTKPELLVPGHTAHIVNGLAAAPIDAPPAIQEIIWAGNQIVGLPYIYGGGHASFISPGYDCSGTVSYALHGANLLSTPMDSTEFMGWDSAGVGTWVTIFANGGHAYMTVAGIRLDTSPANDPSNLPGPRWRPLRPENAGFTVRHPTGL
jgi:cell wall-associated NlpC family hydrolase